MTRIETARVKEVLGMHVSLVKEAAERLSAESDLEDLAANLAELENAVSNLRGSLTGLPFKHSE